MKISELFEGDVIKGNFGKKKSTEPEKQYLDLLDVFGSPELAALNKEGIKLTEKPDDWSSFEGQGYAAARNVHEVKLKKIEKVLGKKFKVYKGNELYAVGKPAHPQVSVKKMPTEDMFIVEFDDGTRYLADRTGARSYIRFWQKIQ